MLEIPLMTISYAIAPVTYFFTVYSLFGWLLENFHSLFTRRLFLKPNFFLGPFKPMYGFAPVLLNFVLTKNTPWPVVILLCFLVPTSIEYVSGVFLEKLTQKKWWDYKRNRFNVQGHVCLTYSICWIFLSFMCVYYFHPFVKLTYVKMEPIWLIAWPLLISYFLIELKLAIRRNSMRKETFLMLE